MATTALKIPSPWSGDEFDPVPWTYKYWFRLYVRTRQLRHLFGIHEMPTYNQVMCSWCGKVVK